MTTPTCPLCHRVDRSKQKGGQHVDCHDDETFCIHQGNRMCRAAQAGYEAAKREIEEERKREP